MSHADRSRATVPWYRRAGVWIGIGTGPGILTVGGGLAARLPLSTLLLAAPTGALLLTGLAVAQGIFSRRLRQPLAQRAASTFGFGFGAGLLNLIVAVGMVGWMSFYAGFAGFALANLLGQPGWTGSLAIAAALFALNELGIGRWNLLVWITTLSALAAAVFALFVLGAQPSWQTGTGLQLPQFLWGTTGVVSYGIVFAMRAGDFTWDLHADSDVVKAGVALFVPLLIFLGIGATLYSAVGDWNLADVLARTRSAALGNAFLTLSIVSPALSGLHSGILALESITPLHERHRAGLLCALSFILGALRFDRRLLSFLDLLGATVPPALIVMLLTARLERKPSRTAALAAWLAGAGTAVLLKLQGRLSHIAVGALASAVVFLAVTHLVTRARVREGMPPGGGQSHGCD